MQGLSAAEPAADDGIAFALARKLGLSWREVRELPLGVLPFLLPLVEEPERVPLRRRALTVVRLALYRWF